MSRENENGIETSCFVIVSPRRCVKSRASNNPLCSHLSLTYLDLLRSSMEGCPVNNLPSRPRPTVIIAVRRARSIVEFINVQPRSLGLPFSSALFNQTINGSRAEQPDTLLGVSIKYRSTISAINVSVRIVWARMCVSSASFSCRDTTHARALVSCGCAYNSRAFIISHAAIGFLPIIIILLSIPRRTRGEL